MSSGDSAIQGGAHDSSGAESLNITATEMSDSNIWKEPYCSWHRAYLASSNTKTRAIFSTFLSITVHALPV